MHEIELKPLQDEDIGIFSHWLDKEYIYKWLCPDGDGEREAWLEEVNGRNNEYGYHRLKKSLDILSCVFESKGRNAEIGA